MTEETSLDGDPALSTPDADEVLQATLQHVVVTYSPIEGRRIYVNGDLVSQVDPIPGGTLIDWESGMIAGLKPLIDKVDRELTRNDILEAHARHESGQQAQTPGKKYFDLLATVYRRLAEEWDVTVSWEECVNYGQSVRNWPAFPDSREALTYLNARWLEEYVLERVAERPKLRHVILMCSAVNEVDASGLESLEGVGPKTATNEAPKPAPNVFFCCQNNINDPSDRHNPIHPT